MLYAICCVNAGLVYWLTEKLIGLVVAIPATVWVVVVASVSTLAGVRWTNRASDERLRTQFENDRILRNREREMAFRKETYGAAAEAIAVGINTLGRFTDLSIPPNQLTANYDQKAATLAKIHLIAGEPTIRAFVDLEAEMTGALLHLTSKRIPLLDLQDQLAQIDVAISSYAHTRDSMLELIRHQNIEGVRDDRRFNVLVKTHEFEQGRIDEAREKQRNLRSDLRLRYIAFTKECFAEFERVYRLMPAVLITVREELEMSININIYAEIIAQAQQRTDTYLNRFLESVMVGSSETLE